MFNNDFIQQDQNDIRNKSTTSESGNINTSNKSKNQKELNQFFQVKLNPIFTNRETIKKYPFNGESSFLISKIFLIGYEKLNLEKMIRKELKDKLHNRNISTNNSTEKIKKCIHLNEKPIILQTFMAEKNSQNTQKLNQTDFFINFIYPKRSKVLLTQKKRTNNVIFTINNSPTKSKDNDNDSDNDNDIKDNHNRTNLIYYAYIYHIIKTIDGIKYYIPQAICIQSNYPYFSNYSILCQYYTEKLNSKYFKELWLYQLVNLPSPINAPYQLAYFPSSEINYTTPLLFQQLSGYPLLQLKIYEIFNILPVDLIIEVFIFTLLEIEMIFFCENLEVLNIVMYIFAVLNYPLNSSNYFSNVLSVSLDTFKEGIDSSIAKDYPCMKGVFTRYNPSLDAYAQKKAFFVIDLNEKRIQYKAKSQDAIDELRSSFNKNQILFEYINKLLKGPNASANYLEIALTQLKSELIKISNCITYSNINSVKLLPNFFSSSNETQNINYNLSSNKLIQEKFYLFIIQIASYFYSFNNLESPMKKTGNYSISSYDNQLNLITALDPSLIHFRKLLSKSNKYRAFILDFIQNSKCSNLDYIPLTCLQESIHQYKCNLALNQQTYFVLETIDEYYHINNNIGLMLTMDNYYNSIAYSSNKSSFVAQLNENNVYNQEIINYIAFSINSLKRKKKKKANKMNNQELFHLLYLNKNNKANDPLKIQSRFEVKCPNLIPFSDKNKNANFISSNNQENNSHMNVNDISNDYISILQEIIEKKYIIQLSINDLLLCCYVLFFIIIKIVEKNDSIEQLELITDLISKHKHIYSLRRYISIMINYYISSLIQKHSDANKSNIDNDDNAEDNDNHIYSNPNDNTRKCYVKLALLLEKLNFIPNNELMSCLNLAFENEYITYQEIIIKDTNRYNTNQNNEDNKLVNVSQSYLQYNIGKKGFYKEEYFIQLARNISYNGDLYIEEELNTQLRESEKSIEINRLCWNVEYKKRKYTTPIYSPMKLFIKLNAILKKLTVNTDEVKTISKIKLINLCCVLIFYVKNIKDIFMIPQKVNQKNEIDERYKHHDHILFLYDIINRIYNLQ